MIKHQCPTCAGKGEVELNIEESEETAWYRGRGDKDLWDKYSHASIRGQRGRWSEFFLIASFYRYDGDYSINFWKEGGSWPVIKPKDLKEKFRFIERKTGRETTFEAPEQKPIEAMVYELMDADPSITEEHLFILIHRLGYAEKTNTIMKYLRAWKLDRKEVTTL